MTNRLAALLRVCAHSLAILLFAPDSYAKVVHYQLTATKGPANLSGKTTVDWALMINGSIPAPTLEFTEGDDAEIEVNNQLDEEVSVHWHGILLPSSMDGVPYVNTPPILPGKSYVFRFKIRQHGTYWYHSHTMLQEQKGLFGGIIIHPRDKKIAYDRDVVVVLSDWSDENADQILKNLRKDGDYYLYKKNAIRSWLGAIQANALGTYLNNEWTRMGGMDLSDVGYDAFLMNGKPASQLITGRPGERIRIRIINASASSYFYVSLGQQPMTVISADGLDIKPVKAKEIMLAIAETYDLLFDIPLGKNTELRATAQDGTGYASGWIGAGAKVAAISRPLPDPYASMDHSSHGGLNHDTMPHKHPAGTDTEENHAAHHHDTAHKTESDKGHKKIDHSQMDHASMDHSAMGHASNSTPEDSTPVIGTLTVDDLKAPHATVFPKSTPVYELKLVLGGDMERYVWHVNGKAIHQERLIEVRQGEVVRFIFENETMMHHPMHLHGHFFRVLNSAGDFSVLKHTVDVPPHGTRTIEFLANEPGTWMLHCHNLYHMKTGMARVIKYSSFTPAPEVVNQQAIDPHQMDHVYASGMLEAATNHAQINLRLTRTWDALEAHVETRDYKHVEDVEGEILYRRWITNYLSVLGGGGYFGEYLEQRSRGLLGIAYVLPMLVESHLFIDHQAKMRLDLEKRFQWTKWIFSDFNVTFRQQAKTEFELSLMYAQVWQWAAGLMLTEDSLGAGLQFQF